MLRATTTRKRAENLEVVAIVTVQWKWVINSDALYNALSTGLYTNWTTGNKCPSILIPIWITSRWSNYNTSVISDDTLAMPFFSKRKRFWLRDLKKNTGYLLFLRLSRVFCASTTENYKGNRFISLLGQCQWMQDLTPSGFRYLRSAFWKLTTTETYYSTEVCHSRYIL